MLLQAMQLPRHRGGLLERLYFHGYSQDGRQAFSLCHEFLRRQGEACVCVRWSLTLYDREQGRVAFAQDEEILAGSAFRALSRAGSWDDFHAHMASGSFALMEAAQLQGRLYARAARAQWQLQLQRSDIALLHLPHERLYRLPLLRRKLLSRDCALGYRGHVQLGDWRIEGDFWGSSTQLWQGGPAQAHVYAACQGFAEDDSACFAAFASRLALPVALAPTPCLSMASLRWAGQWHHFNALRRCHVQAAQRWSDYQWHAAFENDSHRLECALEGDNPRLLPWWQGAQDQAAGRPAASAATLFARGRVQLFVRGESTARVTLSSPYVQLETLRP